jgi:ABC-2 type transport system permease protein
VKIWAVYRKELRSYFCSPLAYTVIGVYLALSGYFFSVILVTTKQLIMTGVFANMGLMLVFIAPILTMRLLTAEESEGTMELLLTTPVTVFDIVVGKYLAAFTVFLMGTVLTLSFPLFLCTYGSPDFGPIITGYTGFVLLGGAFLAIGLFMSATTDNQVIAGVLTFGVGLALWIVGWLAEELTGKARDIANHISAVQRYEGFLYGVLDLSDVTYFITIILAFVFLTCFAVIKRNCF